MDGIHDLGGMHGFGHVVVERDEPVFHGAWEARVFAVTLLSSLAGNSNIDASRHAMESVAPHDYLTRRYYWRWLVALEKGLLGCGALRPGEVDAEARRLKRGEARREPPAPAPQAARANLSARRTVEAQPRFAVGESVRAKNIHPPGHTRLPRYVRGHAGTIAAAYGAWVFPDTHAAGAGENPQHVYCVRFEARELWGADAEPSSAVHVDLFESYLEPA
jgi:nitrile hydratase